MSLTFLFGRPRARAAWADDGVTIELPNAVVAGTDREIWDGAVSDCRRCGTVTLWRQGETLWGAGFADTSKQGFEQTGRQLYADALQAADGLALHRAWNFLPHINAMAGGLENYRAFCVGRAEALDTAYGAGAAARLPAATGVGTGGDVLAVVFVAGPERPRHVENPAQTPAYRYPRTYGPRAPSFARGSLVCGASGPRLLVSGTGSIRGSESLHPDDVVAQCEVVLDNVDLVARGAGLPGLDRTSPGRRRFRVYLRRPQDWGLVRPMLEERLLRRDDGLVVVQADICRRELLMEIEASVATAAAD